MPRLPASRRASMDRSLAPGEMAGVIPVIWNQSTPAKARPQSTVPGLARESAEYSRS